MVRVFRAIENRKRKDETAMSVVGHKMSDAERDAFQKATDQAHPFLVKAISEFLKQCVEVDRLPMRVTSAGLAQYFMINIAKCLAVGAGCPTSIVDENHEGVIEAATKAQRNLVVAVNEFLDNVQDEAIDEPIDDDEDEEAGLRDYSNN